MAVEPGPSSHGNLAAYYLAQYRAQFGAALAAGAARPFVLPWSVAGSFVLPVLYLSVPHRHRPWLRRLRGPVVLAVALLNLDVIANGTSSANIAVSYAAGLAAGWGTIWTATLVLFMRVQTDVKRVAWRPKKPKRKGDVIDDDVSAAVDESVARVADDWEQYWQAFPEDGGFGERLEWVWDLYLSFRGAGMFLPPFFPHIPNKGKTRKRN